MSYHLYLKELTIHLALLNSFRNEPLKNGQVRYGKWGSPEWVLSECVLLTWPCKLSSQIDSGKWQSLPSLSKCECWLCRKCPPYLPTPPPTAPHKGCSYRAFLTLSPWSGNNLICSILVYLNVTTRSPCSDVCNDHLYSIYIKYNELQDAEASPAESPSVWLSFLHSFTNHLTQTYPWNPARMQQLSGRDCFPIPTRQLPTGCNF